jgi:hypothetical protein
LDYWARPRTVTLSREDLLPSSLIVCFGFFFFGHISALVLDHADGLRGSLAPGSSFDINLRFHLNRIAALSVGSDEKAALIAAVQSFVQDLTLSTREHEQKAQMLGAFGTPAVPLPLPLPLSLSLVPKLPSLPLVQQDG